MEITQDTIITMLIRLYTETNEDNVERDFGKKYMLYIVNETSDLLKRVF